MAKQASSRVPTQTLITSTFRSNPHGELLQEEHGSASSIARMVSSVGSGTARSQRIS